MKTQILDESSEAGFLDRMLLVDEEGNLASEQIEHWASVAARLVESGETWSLVRLIIVGRIEQARSIMANRSTTVDQWRYEQGAEAALEELFHYVINLSRRNEEENDEV